MRLGSFIIETLATAEAFARYMAKTDRYGHTADGSARIDASVQPYAPGEEGAHVVGAEIGEEVAVLQEEPLDGIGEFSHAARRLALPRFSWRTACVAGAFDLAQPLTLSENGLGLSTIKSTLIIEQFVALLLPYADHLGSLFLERHPAEEVLHAPCCRKLRVSVGRDSRSYRGLLGGGPFCHNPYQNSPLRCYKAFV